MLGAGTAVLGATVLILTADKRRFYLNWADGWINAGCGRGERLFLVATVLF
jgi:hypothetical protein